MSKERPLKIRLSSKTFRKGLNMTVQHGDSWHGFTGAVEVLGGTQLRVLNTVYFEHFHDIQEDESLLQFGHDPDTQIKSRLFQQMRGRFPAQYGKGEDDRAEFTKETPVTLVLFIVSKYAPVKKLGAGRK